MSHSGFSSSNRVEDDPISKERTAWFHGTANPTRDEAGLYDYCIFCLTNFRSYNRMVNNVCQSCGRVAEPVMRDKEPTMKVTSLNSGHDWENMRAVSMEYDYSPMMNNDPTTNHPGMGNGNYHMTANSAGDAMQKIRQAEALSSKMAAAALRNERFLVKTNLDKDKNKRQFDNNL